jgi:hypothetical protein
MKVWFGCTTARWEEYKENYFAIRDYLKELGCVVMFDWLEGADKYYTTTYKTRNIKKVYNQVIEAINAADISVIEHTVPNFSSSHQINYSIFKKKPTLVMRLYKDNQRFTDSYIEAIESDFLTVKEYTKENYKDILKQFIGLSSIEQGAQRYNIVLGNQQKYYLDWASNKYKKSRSNIIRNAVDKVIEKDEEYGKYLN